MFESILVAIRDPRQGVRDAAARALRACLFVIGERESRLRTWWYARVFEDALRGLQAGDSNSAHGALHAMAQLLDACDGLDEHRLSEAFRRVWLLKESRVRHIRSAVLAVLPRLAERAPPALSAQWVPESTKHLVGALRASAEHRGAVFIAVGRMARAAGPGFEEHIPAVVRECREALTLTSAKGFARTALRAPHPEALECLAMLAEAHGAAVEPHIVAVLPSMFHGGLSPALTAALAVFVRHSPSLLPEVQWRLLDVVSSVLTRLSYRQWLEQPPAQGAEAAPALLQRGVPGVILHASASTGNGAQAPDPIEQKGRADQLAFALDTLASFDLSGCNLLRFACECVSLYLEDASAQVRCASAKACCKILLSEVASAGRPNGIASRFSNQVLERVTIAAVSDEDPNIRHAILCSLSAPFDAQLAKDDLLELLLMTMHDSNARVREVAVLVLGRVSCHNPAHAMPALRGLLMDLLTELQLSWTARAKEEAARVLGKLVCSSPQLIQPYAPAILEALMPQLLDPNADVAACALATLGELAVAAGSAVDPVMPELLPRILPILQDHASQHTRRTALRAMSQLLRSTGYPAQLWRDASLAPSVLLLTTLLTMLRSEQDRATRLELLRALGVLGAPDPSIVMKMQLDRQREASAALTNTGAQRAEGSAGLEAVGGTMGPAQPDFYPSVAIRALTRILCAAARAVAARNRHPL